LRSNVTCRGVPEDLAPLVVTGLGVTGLVVTGLVVGLLGVRLRRLLRSGGVLGTGLGDVVLGQVGDQVGGGAGVPGVARGEGGSPPHEELPLT
jgi:hypothetical protein